MPAAISAATLLRHIRHYCHAAADDSAATILPPYFRLLFIAAIFITMPRHFAASMLLR